MTPPLALAQLVALLRAGTGPWSRYSESFEEHGSALPALEQEHGLLAGELAEAELATVAGWTADGLVPVTLLDRDYPDNLRAVHDRPPLLFVAGRYERADARSVAVVGSRSAGPEGIRAAEELSAHLVDHGFTVVSGLARGIDGAAHRRALHLRGRTVAVIGTGLRTAYPPEHADLQAQIAAGGAVVSQFWPDAPPTRQGFPLRNAVMSGLALGTAIVEATHTSGTRIQARRALQHGRPVFLRRALLDQEWARALARRPGTHVFETPAEVTSVLDRLTAGDALTG